MIFQILIYILSINMKIKQSLKDKRKIEHFVLENEMKVILI